MRTRSVCLLVLAAAAAASAKTDLVAPHKLLLKMLKHAKELTEAQQEVGVGFFLIESTPFWGRLLLGSTFQAAGNSGT